MAASLIAFLPGAAGAEDGGGTFPGWQRSYDVLSDEIETLETELAALQRAKQQIESERLRIDEVAISEEEMAALAQELIASLGALLAVDEGQLWPAQDHGRMLNAARRLLGVERPLRPRLFGPSSPRDDPAFPFLREIGYVETPSTRGLDKLFTELEYLGYLDSPDVQAPPNDTANRRHAQSSLDIATDTGALVASFEERKKQVLSDLLEAEQKVGAEAEQISARLAAARSEQVEIVRSVNRQTGINEILVWAIFVMLAVLVVLFFSLRLFPPEAQQGIIERRTLVELTTMAFMLLTIIILGTGRILDSQVLGTLLGTIAGYVFTRRGGPGNDQG